MPSWKLPTVTPANEQDYDLDYLLIYGSPIREELHFWKKINSLMMILRCTEILLVIYLLLIGSIGILLQINIQAAQIPLLAILFYFSIILFFFTISMFSLIRTGSLSIGILVIIGIVSILAFPDPFLRATNFFLTFFLGDIGKQIRYFLKMKKNYESYPETIEIERLYLSFHRLVKSLLKRDAKIFILGMIPLLISSIIEINIGYRTTLLYPFLIFIALIIFFMMYSGMTRKLRKRSINSKLKIKT